MSLFAVKYPPNSFQPLSNPAFELDLVLSHDGRMAVTFCIFVDEVRCVGVNIQAEGGGKGWSSDIG